MSLKILFTAVVIYCCTSIECKEYRYDYKYVPEVDGWLKVHLFPAKWQNARLRCQFEAAVLASPETPELLRTLKSIASEHFPCGMYTGVHATFSPGDYFSVEGTPLGKLPIEWAPNEPDNFEENENCIILQGNGTAADVKCTELYPYVCYKGNPITLNECGTIDSGYTYEKRTGKCYKFHYVGRNWTRAFMACAAEGAHLAIINSNVEANVLTEIFGKHLDSIITGGVKTVHIGFQNWGEKRTFTTIHGQTLQEAGYSKFEAGFTMDGVICGGMYWSARLVDLGCEIIAPFICEKSPDSLLGNKNI